MDRANLITAVEAAISTGARLKTYKPKTSDYTALFTASKSGVEVSHESLFQLEKVLHDSTSLHKFEGWTIASGDGHGERLDSQQAAHWLLAESIRRGASVAVDDLLEFLATNKGESIKVQLLYGISIADRIQLSNGLEFIPFEQLPYSLQRETFRARHSNDSLLEGRWPVPVALALRLPMARVLYPPNEEGSFADHKREDAAHQELLNDAVTALALFGDLAPVPSGRWAQATGRGVPSGGMGALSWSIETSHRLYSGVSLTREHLAGAVEPYLALNDAVRRRLGVPLRYLYQSARAVSIEDAAIDLRVALETALLGNGEGEKAFRTATYGAWLIASDPKTRQDVYRRIKRAYNLASQVVHGGSAKAKKGETPTEVVSDTKSLVVQILRRLIELKGDVDLEALSLGSSLIS